MRDRPSVLLYSPDSIGLGHMQRHLAISRRLVREVDDVCALMLVGSGVGAFYDQPQGVDSIKLPSVQKTGTNKWQPRTLGIATMAMRELRAGIIKKTVEVVDPTVFIVDHLVTGVWDELLPTFEMIRSENRSTKIILGLRDILDTPARIKEKWEREGYYDLIDKYYDQILIYGSPDIYPSARLYGLEERFSKKITYCGYICAAKDSSPGPSNGAQRSKRAAKSELGIESNKLIVVTAGGGHDAYPMMSSSIAALRELGPDFSAQTIMITGPLMPAHKRGLLVAEAAGLPITIVPWMKNLATHLTAADLVITMGGYNSMLENVCLGKRTIVIPRNRPSAEQQIRAKLFGDLGLVSHVDPDGLTAENLAGVIRNSFDLAVTHKTRLPMGGIENAVKAITENFNQTTPFPEPVRCRSWSQAEPVDKSHAFI